MSALDGVRLHLVDSVDDAMAFMRWLGESRPVLAVDTETEGLDWWAHRVRLIQFGDARTGWAIPWHLWGGVARDALSRYEGRLVFHNSKFDTHMIETWSERDGFAIKVPRHLVDDTRTMAHILDPTRTTSLKNLTAMLIDRKAATAQRVLDEAMHQNHWTWATVPVTFESYWAYGALDTVLTAQLWELLLPQVSAEAPTAYQLEMASQWVVQKMERRGVRVDVPYTERTYHDFTKFVDDATDWCVRNYGVKPGSNPDVIRRLEEDGLTFTKYTEKGALALDKEVLEGIIATTGHPLAKVVFERRRVQKLASTYLKNFLERQVDGVLHPIFNTLGARTSRMSMEKPSLHNLPRRSSSNPAAIAVRNGLVAREGHELILCDFDQIEMRLFAHLSGDPGLRGAFGEGDFFTNVCRELWGDPTIVKKDERRQHTKNGMYALGYGAGPAKIALTTGQTLEAVQQFLDMLAVRFPGIKFLQNDVASKAAQRRALEGSAYVRSPLTGRRQPADGDRDYALVNYLIQMTAAEILKMKDVELDLAGVGDYMVLNVHDEVILDVPTDIADQVAVEVSRVMNDDQLLSVPLTAGIDRTDRWGMKGE